MEEGSVYDRFRDVALCDMSRIALVVDDASYDYGTLLRWIDGAAAHLTARGCGPHDAVAVLVPNSLDFVVGVFATFAIGATLVPLNPSFRVDELSHYLGVSEPKAMLAPEAILATVGAALEIPIMASSIDTWTSEPRQAEGGAPVHECTGAGHGGVYMFSSGSTGRSKRISRSESQLLAEYDAMRRTVALSASDCILCTVPMFHAHGFGNALFAALLSGAKLVLRTREFNARAVVASMAEHGVTMYPAVPFMFKMIGETKFSKMPDLTRLRLMISAGAALPESVSRSVRDRLGHPVVQLYGSTETGALSINVMHGLDKPTSVGRPLQGYEIEVRSDEGVRLGPDERGEVWVRSPAMTQAYDGLADMSAACFVDGFFFTGDMGYHDADGDLYITERKKLLINVAGYKVDPLEVEDVLARHPAVQDVVVIGVPHPGYGEEVKAVIVTRPDPTVTPEELVQHAASHLAEYKVPRRVEFIAEIPRSPLGKVLRKYL